MKFLSVLLVYAFMVHAAGAKEIDLDAPEIVFDKLEHDFGTMAQYNKVETEIGFRNAGTAPLIIEKVTATCGCTAVAPAQREVAPGGKSEIKVTFNSESFSGRQVKYIDVHTNDPKNKIVRLSIHANILVDLRASSLVLSFGDVSRGAKELTVRIFSPTGRKFAITDVKPSLEFIQTSVERVEDKGDETEYMMKVTANPPAGGGGFNGTIVVGTDMEGVPPLKLTVSGYSRTRTEVVPPRLFFGVVNLEEETTRSITLRANGWEGLKIEKVDAPDTLIAAATETAEGQEWNVDVTVKKDAPDGMLREKIVIHTNDEESKEIEVQVYVLVRREKAE